jgi:hypothetical protein
MVVGDTIAGLSHRMEGAPQVREAARRRMAFLVDPAW